MEKLKVGLVGINQINFTGDKAAAFARACKELSALTESLSAEIYLYPERIITEEEARCAVAAVERENCDFVLVCPVSFAAGATILPFAKMKPRLGLWAIPEPNTTGEVQLNSWCGINMYASILTNYMKEYHLSYKWFFGWPSEAQFQARFSLSVRALRAMKNMKGARVTLVGGIAPGFNDLYYDERLAEKRLGVRIERNCEFSEIKDRALSYRSTDYASALQIISEGYTGMCERSKAALDLQARVYQAYVDFSAAGGYAALAVSCWPKIQDDLNLVACSTLAKLNEHGIPAACEGDAPGAVSQLFLHYLAEEAVTTLLDLSSYDTQEDLIQLWHCGPTANCMANDCGVCMRTLTHNLADGGQVLRGSINDLTFRPGTATVMRFTGEWDRMFLLTGEMISKEKEVFEGSSGWMGKLRLAGQPLSAMDFINTVLTKGFQHHFPLVYGDLEELCLEAAAWLGLSQLTPVPYQNYLQLIQR